MRTSGASLWQTTVAELCLGEYVPALGEAGNMRIDTTPRLRADRSVSFSELARTDRGAYVSVTGGRSASQASSRVLEATPESSSCRSLQHAVRSLKGKQVVDLRLVRCKEGRPDVHAAMDLILHNGPMRS